MAHKGGHRRHLETICKLANIILRPASVVHIRNRLKSWPLFYDVLHAKCFSYAVLIENMS